MDAKAYKAETKERTIKVLMVGTTGKYAGLVLPELKKRWAIVRALVQEESKASSNALVPRTVLGREPRTLRQYIHELASRSTDEPGH